MATPATARLLRLAGMLAWLMVGIPTALQGMGRPAAFAVWLAGFLAFGAGFAWTSTRLGSPGTAWWTGLLAQAACVVTITAVQCRGYEGTLLVLIAMQLGLTTSRRVGLTWVIAQTLLLAWAIQHHWSLRAALQLTPPYLGFQVLAYFVFEVLSRETRARAELGRAHAELIATRELLAESARLNERLRIGRELHDAMGHHLAALSLNLEILARDRPEPSPVLQTARTLTTRLLDDVESVVTALGEDPGLDLGQALSSLAAAIPRPRIHVDAQGLVLRDPERAHALLRCCQEVVTNAVKHASAANVWISIQVRDGLVELTARDDGLGATESGAGHGLVGMRARLEEKGGALHVESGPGTGFQLRATLPTDGPNGSAR